MGRLFSAFTLVSLFALFASSSLLASDEVRLTNGGKLVGKLIEAEDGALLFDVEFVGQVKIDISGVESISTDNTVTILRQNGKVLKNKKMFVRDDQMLLVDADDAEAPVRYSLDNIKMINPEPWQIGDGYKWFGTVSAAFLIERGNTNSDENDIAIRSIWRSLEDRYTFLGENERDKSDAKLTKDNTKLTFKYDYFLEDIDDYMGGLLQVEDDNFADLRLRTIVGPYLGRQFFETSLLNLQAEIGPVYVKEEFYVAPDNEYPGGRWDIYATSDIAGGSSTAYLRHDGLVDFTEKSDLILNTTIGISTPLYGGLEGSAEIVFEYDGGAVEGVNKTDETYNFRLGYSW
ncbi:DUF481 domain-containing protein [Oceanicoccus sagamiensis]|nr:DUF481 domain-containing protein [Oceanicoccus sagamiensis]